MRKWIVVGLIVLTALLGTLIARSFQTPAIRAIDEAILREYAGVYQWDRNAFLYLQIWPELTGTNQLVAFDETGELRTLYPTEPDRFLHRPRRGGFGSGRVAGLRFNARTTARSPR